MAEDNKQSEESAATAGASGTPPTIPDHVLLRPIGKGSYGEIWLARSTLGACRAVKVVYRQNFTDTRPYEREFSGIKRFEPFSREHEGLVDILQVGRNDEVGFFYYVMELADDATARSCVTREGERPCEPKHPSESAEIRARGDARPPFSGTVLAASHLASSTPAPQHPDSYVPRTLAHEIRARGGLPTEEVLRMSVALAEGLQYLHSKGLVHRDIKPSNIIFVGGQPKLADVGLVAELGDPQSLVGTVGFMAPEGPGTARADIFSLGKVIYEALTGKDRQEFPELPTRLGGNGDESRFLELNEVILKACAKEPRDRYQSAGEMLADLRLLQGGKSLRLTRIRRQKLRYTLRVAAIVLAVAGIAGLVWERKRLSPAPVREPEAEILFTDDFDSPQLSSDRWTWSTKEWPGRDNTGHREFRVAQTNGELWIEARVQPERGWTTCGAAWVDSKANFRDFGECRVEIELSGTNQRGCSVLSITAGQAPLDPEDSVAVRLVAMPGNEERLAWNASVPLVHESVRVDLLPSHQAAVVYPDARIPEQFKAISLGGLAQWRLRFYTKVESSESGPGGDAVLRVKRIAVLPEPASNTLLGHIVNEVTGLPIDGAIIKDDERVTLARSWPNGDFKLTTSTWPARIEAQHPDFAPSGLRTIADDERRRGPMTIELHKQSYAVGDVVEVVSSPNVLVGGIGFVETNLWALTYEGDGDAAQSVLMLVDLGAKRLSAPSRRFHTGTSPIRFFSQCHDRILATGASPGGIYDLTATKQSLMLTPNDPANGRRIQWPMDCAFDGQFLWFVENASATNWFGLRAMDLQSLEIKHSLRSPDDRIHGLAWDGDLQEFWVSNLRGKVYAVRRDTALREGTLQRGRGREFPGNYGSLAFGAGHLWGVDTEHRQICKIKIRD